MKLAIMQPYIFPYLGYFQLINAVDTFVFYDDVNFISQGWINRNNILIGGKSIFFTIPLESASFKLNINEIRCKKELYVIWKKKFLKTLQNAYSKAPYFTETYDLISEVLEGGEDSAISELAMKSVIKTSNYLGINTEFKISSNDFINEGLKGQDRVLSMCLVEGATSYINPIGGLELYDKQHFSNNKTDLFFIKSEFPEYNQFKFPFVKGLSVIDLLMFNESKSVNQMLKKYELI
jgi:hypothetical protein